MSNFDHYAAARELIARPDQAGHVTEAAALNAAMEEGATGTEIFMALRFHVAEIIKRVPLAGDSQTLALRLLTELDDSLE